MFQSCKKHPYHKLAIIGNGFDLAHHYETSYRSFSCRVSSPILDKFQSYCEDEPSINTWYDFENNIRILTEKLFLQSYDEACDYDKNRNQVYELQGLFSGISDLLKNYLKQETSGKPFAKIASIEKNLDSKTIAINFNYTDTAKKYTNNVIAIHGSLDENEIILGYDFRIEPCLAQYEDMYWSKIICRERLAFRRFLQKRRIFISSKKQNSLLSSLESYLHWDNTGRGLEDEMKKCISSYRFIHWFVTKYKRKSMVDRITYSKIDTLIILGHGIEADRVLLENIVSRCNALKEVVLYRYEKESDQEFEKKKDFFKTYCGNIKTAYY